MSNETNHTIDTTKDMFTTAEADILIDRIDNNPSLKGWTARSEMRQKIYAKWRIWLWKSYGESLPDFIEHVIYRMAWENGYSDGLHAVESHFQDLCEFARTVRG